MSCWLSFALGGGCLGSAVQNASANLHRARELHLAVQLEFTKGRGLSETFATGKM